MAASTVILDRLFESNQLPSANPVPLPPGSVDGTYFGPQNRPTVNQKIKKLPTVAQRYDAKIIVVMKNTNLTNSMSVSAIFTKLQEQFPNTPWTLELLNYRLNLGLREARFQKNRKNLWSIINKMAYYNYPNHVFATIVSTVEPLPCQTTSTVSVYNGYYGGYLSSLPCSSTNPTSNTFVPQG